MAYYRAFGILSMSSGEEVVRLDDIKQIALDVIAGLIVHFTARAIENTLDRRHHPKHMR